MKYKSKLFLNIATIALCLCAIAVGVYSAKTASLNVGGQIGFEAHNCDVDVKVYMYGHSDTAGGAPIVLDDKVDKTLSGAIEIRGANKDLSLGTVYFTDANSNTNKPENIVIDFHFTNKSKFDVMASVTTATCANVAITKSAAVTMDATGGTTTTGNLSITLALKANDSGVYSDIDPTATANANNLNITIKLEKAPPYRLNGQVEKLANDYPTGLSAVSGVSPNTTYVDDFPYYITMGQKDSTNLKWLVIGKMDSNNKVVVLDNDDKAALEAQALLKNVDYVLLSEKSLETRAFDDSSNEYATSSIRTTYLRNETTSGFASTYGLTDSLSLIKARNLENMYTTDNQTFPTGSNSTEADKFWLLSETEVEDIFVEGAATPNSTTYYMTARTTNLTGTSSAWWWLRSPHSIFTEFACCVDSDGLVSNFYVYGDSHYGYGGVRPAFII